MEPKNEGMYVTHTLNCDRIKRFIITRVFGLSIIVQQTQKLTLGWNSK